jgi:DNA-directed RNA polymerase specialized sigma24 family protein
MESLDDLLVPVELKYCERCGGLWFREREETKIYCPGCVPLMADMPTPRRKRVVVVAVNSVDEIEGLPGGIDRSVRGRRQRVIAPVGFLAASIDSAEWLEDAWDSGLNPDLWMYRARTEAMLRKFFRMSVEVGRLPSILESEFFRTHVTSYSVSSFEDAVIFVHYVERCFAKLDRLSQTLIARVILQGYSHEEAGRLLGCPRERFRANFPTHSIG